MRIDFAIIGAQKSGTTSLAHQLAQHPGICFCKRKEPLYFNEVVDWRSGIEGYHRLYEPSPGQICGEASTTYSAIPEFLHTHRSLHEYNPDIKLLYLVRQPLDRIISHYSHRLLNGSAKGPPEVEVLANPIYVNRTRYGVQLEPYYDLFPARQIMVVLFDDYVSDTRGTLRRIAAFLGVSADAVGGIDLAPQNVSTDRTPLRDLPGLRTVYQHARRQVLNPSLRALLRKLGSPVYHTAPPLEERPVFPRPLLEALWTLLEYDVRRLEELMGRELVEWRERYAQLLRRSGTD